ncbi:MAG: ParA family protein [Clostridia bacterium]|jgi:chromosome partitioning protein|nr:ParA family protein [Clostridia bacterium]
MQTISFINLKGGVGKTITSFNTAYILAALFNKKVLVIDNDKQGNTTKMFGLHSYKHNSIAELLEETAEVTKVIRHTEYENIDLIPANMNLLTANRTVLLDTSKPQQTRLKKALEAIRDNYDFCIIDNAPDVNISVINALVASDNVIIPVKIDNFTFDGMSTMIEQVESIKENFNSDLDLTGVLITMYRKNDVNMQGVDFLNTRNIYIFESKIRWTQKVDESTFTAMPIIKYSPRCGASKDYMAFAEELLKKCEG